MKKIKPNKQKGITLIALVITIIVLLILAGVSIATLTGENGILTRANDAKIEQSHATVKDGISLAYNEWQIEINTANTTKLASTQIIKIQGESENQNANTSSFLDFLATRNYIIPDTDGIIDTEELTGSKQALGNGTGTSDVYKIEEKDNSYILSYYDKDGDSIELWKNTANNTSTGSVDLEPDTGKEALILQYQVSAGDIIELPYYSKYYSGINDEYDATFNFKVNWGDGTITEGITNDNIEEKAIHTYTTAGTYEIKIEGTYESLYNDSQQGIDKLIKVIQWGTTGLRTINLVSTNITEIATPTESSFTNLSAVSFSNTDLTYIPDKLFANCTQVQSFAWCFKNCINLTSIPEKLFANCIQVQSFAECFEQCDNLTSIPEKLFANCTQVQSFAGCFRDCDILTSIPENLFANCTQVQSFEQCFANCFNLTGKAPELWLTGTNSEENNYQGTPDGVACFGDCYRLENYEEIPDYWRVIPS